MKYHLADVGHYAFFEQFEKFREHIELLLQQEDFDSKSEADKIIDNVKEYISKHITPSPDFIIGILKEHYLSIDDFILGDYGLGDKPKKERNRLLRFLNSLVSTTCYLSTIDSLINPETNIKIETATDKSDYLLSKLNMLFGDEMYSATLLLELNDIKLRQKEGREIIEDLHRRGYVIMEDQYGTSDKVKISVKGAAYIERKTKPKNRTVGDKELNKRIDNIIEHLTTLGYGQEIIFNEIEELRELQNKLSKKSWKQLLKGKLIDLTLDKLISIDTANSVYEYLAQGSFKLLK